MSFNDKIKSKPYRNWVRGALGLFYLRNGLYPFTDRIIKAEHAGIVQNLPPCTNCTIENILHSHARMKTNRNCPTCSKIYDDIVLKHRFMKPHWVTDCSTWYNDHWQFAKCFLTTTNKGPSKTAAETDASGLLSIIINGLFFQSELQCTIDPPNDIFSQVRDIRNEILHKSDQDLTDQEVARYLQSMIAVIEDKKTLSTDPAAQAAAKKLKEILKDELIITISEEASVIQIALDAIKEGKEQAEESIRKVAEEARSSLRQQTSEFTTETDAAKEQAVEEVASTVSTVFKETYEPEIKKLKQGHKDHENRLRAQEAKLQNLQRKQLELEQHVANQKIAEEKHQTRIKNLKEKQDLQKHLVGEYQRHYVKTWISPLMTQKNDVNIRDVYVSPRMVVEENKDDTDGNTTEAGKDSGTNNKHIESYRDLFGTEEKRNRKIFIVGDVGTGKSSFCKMMLQNWCSFITKRKNSDDSGVMDEQNITHEKENNTCEMNRFNFLFYIPLREMPKEIDDIVDMIKVQSGKYRTLVDDMFTNDSERILILVDGLDKWAPPSSKKQSQNDGIPKCCLAGDSTILTTSRPSSRGILNLKSSELDLKVTLLGLKDSSVHTMIQNYMKLLKETSTSAVRDFYKKLSDLKLEDIHEAPMFLQQIIWLHCKGHNIGKSRSFIYSDIVNTILAWELDKLSAAPMLHDCENSSFEKLPLPKNFDNLEKCQYNRRLLLLIGHVAYDAYIKQADSVSSLVFGRYKLNKLGVTDDGISAILRTGILTEFSCTDPTQAKSRLSFIHTSYVEFFAALYICSRYLSGISDFHSSVTALTILESLIAVTPETSVSELLRLKNVFIMICGLVPDLTEHVCECIYKLTPRGGNIDENINRKVKRQIHILISDCLSEHNSVDQETLVKCKLRHLFQKVFLFGICFSDIVPDSVETCDLKRLRLSHEQCSLLSSFLSQTVLLRSLEIDSNSCTKDKCAGHTIDLTNHRKLQSIELLRSIISISGTNHSCLQSCIISDCKLSHEQWSLLSSFLSQGVSLKTLEIEKNKCNKDECEGHTIDLTDHRELQNIVLLSNSKLSVSGLNHICLQSFKFSNCMLSHERCSFLSSFLSQAVSLRSLELHNIECKKDKCEGHTIDMTNHSELQNVGLLSSTILVSGINHTCPQSFKISDGELSHEQCSLLSSFLSEAVSLRTLEIYSIKCTTDNCEGHAIDMTRHTELQNIILSNSNIYVSGINHTCLQCCTILHCKLLHEQCSLLSSCLSQAVSLLTLEIVDVKCTQDECEGHTIDLPDHKNLQCIKLSNCAVSVFGIDNTVLESCILLNCRLSHEQCTSLSSCLSEATLLKTLMLYEVECIKPECEGHNIDLCSQIQLHRIGISRCDKIPLSDVYFSCLTKYIQLNSLCLSTCNTIFITSINPTCLQWCTISNCNLLNKQCASLCTFLSQAESLRELSLVKTKCIEDTCEGYYIDLTNHKQLEHLTISDCNMISMTGINPTLGGSCKISRCILSHEQCSSLFTFLSQAESLRWLSLDNIKCIEDVCEGHCIDLTNHEQLSILIISNCCDISDQVKSFLDDGPCNISN